MLYLAITTSLVFVAYCFAVLRSTGFFTASSVFLYIQMLMALGSFPLLDPNRPSDVSYGYVLASTAIIFMVVSAICSIRSDVAPGTSSPPVHIFRPTMTTWIWLLLSATIVSAYYVSVGYSALFQGLANTFSGGDADIAGQRLDSYAGARYLFPGYVNQFKNSLLPALVVLILTYWMTGGRPKHPLVSFVLVAGAIFTLLGTGQRGAFVSFLIVVAVYVYFINSKRFPRGSLRVALIAFFLILVATIGLGRTSPSLETGAGFGDRLATASLEFKDRVVRDQQLSGLAGFRYIYEEPTQNGKEWAQALGGISPGSRGSDLSSKIFNELYGSTRGTSPPSIWGSIYYNFGWGGVLIAPGLLAMLLASITRRGTERRPRNSVEVMGVAGTFTVFGLWAAGDPTYLLNSGLPVFLILWWVGGRSRPRAVSDQALNELPTQGHSVSIERGNGSRTHSANVNLTDPNLVGRFTPAGEPQRGSLSPAATDNAGWPVRFKRAPFGPVRANRTERPDN